jgi:hypothetical protein
MKYYITAWDINNSQILGNSNGQGVINCKDIFKTDKVKALQFKGQFKDHRIIKNPYKFKIFNINGCQDKLIFEWVNPNFVNSH